MSTGLRLGECAVTPLYNIKAVVQATSISPSTLRAWERRYNIARPQRSDSGYRLYSERDIAVIRWLKTQVDIGMSISQAVTWLGNLVSAAGTLELATLPTSGSDAPLNQPPATPQPLHRQDVRDFETLQKEILQALTTYDERAADIAIAEAFAIYPIEQVGDKLFVPLLQGIAERRQRGDLPITAERFAGSYLSQRLASLLRSTPNGAKGPQIWVASVCTGTIDAGAPLLSIYLRRAGYRITYLGHCLSSDEESIKDLVQEVKRFQPTLLLLCGSTRAGAEKIAQISAQISRNNPPAALIAFGGPIYDRAPEWRATTNGIYAGAYANEVVDSVNRLLPVKASTAKRQTEKRQTEKRKTEKKSDTKVVREPLAETRGWQQF